LFVLDPHSGVPIYRQLVEQVRRMVAGGQLRPGIELPSVRELEGLLRRNPGRPMTIAPRRREADPPASRLRQLEPQVDQLVRAARQLDLNRDDLRTLVDSAWEKGDDA
jgi:GntR family transcriptional regulator